MTGEFDGEPLADEKNKSDGGGLARRKARDSYRRPEGIVMSRKEKGCQKKKGAEVRIWQQLHSNPKQDVPGKGKKGKCTNAMCHANTAGGVGLMGRAVL